MSVYRDNGYTNRNDYMESLADEYGVSISTVRKVAAMLGPDEDFDGLVTSLEDLCEDMEV